MQLTGTGALAGFNRTLVIPMDATTNIGPRDISAPVQSFDTEMVQLQGAIFGDPDFDFLQVTAGSNFGLPSPGHTTLTALGGGNWNVDSFFDITYEIEFIGAPGSALSGFSGTTSDTIRMQAGVAAIPEPSSLLLLTSLGLMVPVGATVSRRVKVRRMARS
jgi:hypothetical protein